jgi:hypothetical protein
LGFFVAGIGVPVSGTIGRMPQAPSTRRRWYQFGLGTLLLVVTAFAVWLGYGLQWARSRKQVIQYVESLTSPSPPRMIYPPESVADDKRPWKKMPWTLISLGEQPVGMITLSPDYYSQTECDYIQSLFPEAIVVLRKW